MVFTRSMSKKKSPLPSWGSKKSRSARKAPPSTYRAVRQVINRIAETKTSIVTGTEVTSTTLVSPTSSTLVPLNSIATASGQSNRTGVKITPKFLNVRGAVHMDPSTSTLHARVLVLQHDVGDDPLSTLFENNSGAFAPAGADYSAMFARLNTTKYRILAQRNLRLGNGTGYYNCMPFNINIKLSGNMYYEIGSTIPSKRQLTLIWFARRTDNDESLGTNFEVSYNSKFYYQDM